MLIMKRIFISLNLIAVLVASSAEAQTTYFQTGFDEGMPTSFTLHDEDGCIPSTDMSQLGFAVGKAWIVNAGVDPTDSTNKVAISTSWYKKAATANDWMVTGGVKVESEKSILRFRSMARDADYRDGFKVYISETGTAVADFTQAPVLTVSEENNSWTTHTIDLSSYAGKSIYIAFVNDSKDDAALYLDDIFIGIPSAVSISLTMPRVYDGYGNIPITGIVKATEDVSSYTVCFKGNGQTVSQTFGALKAGASNQFTLDKTFNLNRNETATYLAYAKAGDDSTGVSGKVSAYLWKVVSEEVTGTWCGYCVRGIGAMKYMHQTYPEGFIGIAVHSNSSSNVPDSMAITGDAYLTHIFSQMGSSGYPHAGSNRNAMYWTDPYNISTSYTSIKSRTQDHKFGISLSASYDAATNKINSTTDIYSAEDATAQDFRLAYVVIENLVHRTHAETGITNNYCGYDQINYYAGGTNGKMYGYENMGSVLNADTMYFNDVARDIQPDYNGIGNVMPSTISEGDHFTYIYSQSMPATVLNKAHAELIVLLLNKDGVIINADNCYISGTTTGITAVKENGTTADEHYYNLNGMEAAHPQKGIFLYHGKKIIR